MAGGIWSIVSAFLAAILVAVISHYIAPAWLTKAHCRHAARAGLQAIRVYVAGAKVIPAHQHLQTEWSHLCARTFGEVAANVAEMGKQGPDLAKVSELVAGWLSQAPFVLGNDERVNRPGQHLSNLERCLAQTIDAVPKK